MKTGKSKDNMKQKGLTDSQLVEKYEAGKIDLVNVLKKGIDNTKVNSQSIQPEVKTKF